MMKLLVILHIIANLLMLGGCLSYGVQYFGIGVDGTAMIAGIALFVLGGLMSCIVGAGIIFLLPSYARDKENEKFNAFKSVIGDLED